MKKLVLFLMMVLLSGCSMSSPSAEEKKPKIVHAYMSGKLLMAEQVKAKLEGAGFDVVGVYTVNAKYKLKSVIYTSAAMKKMANKPTRGHAALGRVLIDTKNAQIVVSNPVYFGRAFLQDQANFEELSALRASLQEAFGGLKDLSDRWEYTALSKYQFMPTMPMYDDSILIGEGKSLELLAKLKAYNQGKQYLFAVQLDSERYVVGFDLDASTSRFPERIGVQNSGLLPYTILIEKGQARILAPKYYLAVSYPQLSMAKFMKIATVPNQIEKELTLPFE